MNIGALINFAIQIASIFSGSSKFMGAVKSLLEALSKSPELLEWLTTLLTKPSTGVPDSALPLAADLGSDEALKAAYEASPQMVIAANRLHYGEHIPDTAQPLGAGGLFTLITYLPTIIRLLKQLRDSGVFGQAG